ncbi:MAG: hypothetical protein K2J49_05825 [Muribaculaceae bacterium]|nr:hypothetical protein [Muribaculaceae bacterium]
MIRNCVFMTAMALVMTACDDGRIYDGTVVSPTDDGLTVAMIGELSGCPEYESQASYSVALAAFRDGDEYAVSSKSLGDGSQEVLLSNIPADIDRVEVCLIDRLRKRVATFATQDVQNPGPGVVEFNVGQLDVAMFPAIQREVFSSTCTQCHGATGYAAAGLDLTSGKSFGMLVGIESTVVDGEKRVVAGDAGASVLWQAVATDMSASWAFNHANLLTATKSEFIKNWINNGAK